MSQDLAMKCPIYGCDYETNDAVDSRAHALTAHSGRDEGGMPNGRYIHEQIIGGYRTVCGLSLTAGKRDAWDNRLTDGGLATTTHISCVTCAACAQHGRQEGVIDV